MFDLTFLNWPTVDHAFGVSAEAGGATANTVAIAAAEATTICCQRFVNCKALYPS
ncbi:hypothetical protein ACI2K4_23200 [Micromonospora sp. NPDC050397]|uniref:hypothetical protein n=1 Tax=Micromonospora sp. NPDC050397 TaxID=3364279 RepID=UPI00384DEE69